jgi:ketopantoate reductase
MRNTNIGVPDYPFLKVKNYTKKNVRKEIRNIIDGRTNLLANTFHQNSRPTRLHIA